MSTRDRLILVIVAVAIVVAILVGALLMSNQTRMCGGAADGAGQYPCRGQ